MSDGAEEEDPVPSSDHEAGGSDSGRSRSGRSDEDEGSESDVGLDLVFLPGRRQTRRRRYRGGGLRGIRGNRGRGERGGTRRARTRGSGRGRNGGSTGSDVGVGRGGDSATGGTSVGAGRGGGSVSRGGRGRVRRGGRGRGRGTGSHSRAGDSLTDPQREVLVEGWKKQENQFEDYQFRGGTPGPTRPSAGESASACFNRFFTDEVWDLLVQETNRFAAQVRATLTSPTSRPWHDVDREEIKAFVGIMMAMGICKLPRLEMYWSTTHPLLTPELRKVMPLVRFQQIWRFLHLNDSSKQVAHGQPGYDPLYKVRPLLDLVSPRLESEYNPHEQVSVDEAMIKFKGRLGLSGG